MKRMETRRLVQERADRYLKQLFCKADEESSYQTIGRPRMNNQTRLGRVQSTYFLMVQEIGEGKSTEPDEGKKQAA